MHAFDLTIEDVKAREGALLISSLNQAGSIYIESMTVTMAQGEISSVSVISTKEFVLKITRLSGMNGRFMKSENSMIKIEAIKFEAIACKDLNGCLFSLVKSSEIKITTLSCYELKTQGKGGILYIEQSKAKLDGLQLRDIQSTVRSACIEAIGDKTGVWISNSKFEDYSVGCIFSLGVELSIIDSVFIQRISNGITSLQGSSIYCRNCLSFSMIRSEISQSVNASVTGAV
jgi:hypothetical protein